MVPQREYGSSLAIMLMNMMKMTSVVHVAMQRNVICGSAIPGDRECEVAPDLEPDHRRQ
jgi:hypothetical protein